MLAFSVEEDNLAVVVEPAIGREITRIPLDERCYGVEFSSDNRLLAIASQDKTVRIVEVASGHLVARIEHEDSILLRSSELAFSPDGRFLATNSRKDPTRLFEAATGREIARFEGGFAFGPDSRSLAVAVKNDLRLISPETGHEFARIEHGGPIRQFAFSPDGRLLVTTSEDAAALQDKTSTGDLVRFLKAATGEEIAQFKHDGVAGRIMFSPDSRLLAIASNGGAVRLIEAASGRGIAYAEHGGQLSDMRFSRDGRFLVTGSKNNRLSRNSRGNGSKLTLSSC
jgi:WD40 repeat protein